VTRIAFVALFLLTTAPAYAQSSGNRPAPAARRGAIGGFLTVGGGYQSATKGFTDSSTFAVNAENAQLSTAYEIESGPILSLAGGIRFTRLLSAGAAFTRYSVSGAGALTASIPHPFFFNRPRQISGDISGLDRREHAVHIQVRATVPAGRNLEVGVYGGPSFFSVTQTVVSSVDYDEEYPYDTATFSGAPTKSADESGIGFNVGGEITYLFTRQVGVTGGVQFARASLSIPGADGDVDITAGGLQTLVGLHVKF
jgi:hypothetical protein